MASLDTDGLEQFLVQHMPLPGSICYRTEMEGKQDTSAIMKHTDLLVGLRGFKRFFTQSALKDVLSRASEKKESEWRLATERGVFADETAKQLRAMMRDVSQALVKWKSKRGNKPPPSWLVAFTAHEKDSGEPEHSATTAAPEKEWVYEYCREMRAAYRYPASKTKDAREYCDKMDAGKDTDEIQGTWSDGSTWSAPGMSVSDYMNLKDGIALKLPPLAGSEPACGRKKVEAEWQGQRAHDGIVFVKNIKRKIVGDRLAQAQDWETYSTVPVRLGQIER